MINSRSQKISRRRPFWLAPAFALTLALASAVPARAQVKPPYPYSTNRLSILLIVADDLGYGDLGCYGQTQIKTPNLDKLAAQGMRFTSFYAGSSLNTPSRAALMTGKHTGHLSIRGDGNLSLQPEEVTVAQLLKSVDYSTGALGEWGLGDAGSAGVPIRKGFDEWFGLLNLSDAQNHYPEMLNRTSSEQGEKNYQLTENLNGQKGKYSDDYFTEVALNFLKEEKPVWYMHYKPFFLYLAYSIPRANTLLAAQTGNGMEIPPEDPNYPNETWPQPEKNKAAMITRLDRYVGWIMDKLKEQKVDNKTIIIFTSATGPRDQGGVDSKFFKSAGPFRAAKQTLNEGNLRVPFIVWWPGQIKPGSTSDLPCASWDFLPTATEIAGRPTPKDLDGISLTPTLLGQTQTNRHEFLYWETHEGGFKQAVRTGNWKALRAGMDRPLELYNLNTDPGETTNVADKNPALIAHITDYLKTARTEDNNWPVKTATETPK